MRNSYEGPPLLLDPTPAFIIQAWRGMASDRAPKIILGALLSRTWDIKIAHLVLIFKLQH